MASIEHERIDIAPNLRQVRHGANPAVEIRRRRNRYVRMNLRAPSFTGGNRNNFSLDYSRWNLTKNVLRKHLLAKFGIHDLVHQPKSGHSIFRVEGRSGVVRADFRLCELFG